MNHLHRPGRQSSFRSDKRSAVAAALGVALLLMLAAAAPTAADEIARQVEAARQAIAANGWSWEADDAFLRGLTAEERAALHGGLVMSPQDWKQWEARVEHLPVAKTLPSSFDWRALNGVTPVKNQGSCGSCWAFAALAGVESYVKIYYGPELDLSEQQIISCNPYGAGCSGGWAAAAYDVLMNHGGIDEHCMPYAGGLADLVPCTQTAYLPFVRLSSWRSIPNDIDQLKTAIMEGPVACAVDASGDFETYSGGCYEGGGPWTNHLVLMVGWDDRLCNGAGAWICKNSWGTGFGMAGYFYIKYGAAGIGSGATQPIYAPPPASFLLTAPGGNVAIRADTQTEVRWDTAGAAPAQVDIHFSADDLCFETLVAAGVPNTGSYLWTVPNVATTSGRLLVHVAGNIHNGYGFSARLTILGHKVRYVSVTGSNTLPYESQETAAHTIGAAVLACTGFDSVMIAAGDYIESVSINGPVRLFGGWNADFTQRDPDATPTRWRGLSSALRFWSGAGDFAGVDGVTFHDCQGTMFDQPSQGTHGGAILSVGASPTVRGCVFENSRAAFGSQFGLGGAILAVGGSPVIEACSFIGNVATRGGALALHQPLGAQLRGNFFSANTLSDSTAANTGGALHVEGGAVALSGDVFSDHDGANEGGALFADAADLSMTDVVLERNRAVLKGGGLLVRGGSAVVQGGRWRDNRAGTGGGGGGAFEGGTTVVRNLLSSGNRAGGLGGGLMVTSAAGGSVENCLLLGNRSDALGGGLFVTATGAYAVRNTIIAGNIGNGLAGGGTQLVVDHNDIWDNSGGDYAGVTPGAHDLALDPRFLDAPGEDYALGLHSPCVDRGDPDPAGNDPDGSRADIGLRGGPQGGLEAPAAVAGAAVAADAEGGWRLSWTPNAEPDVAAYVVYRDTAAVFIPGPDKSAALLPHPTAAWIDRAPPPGAYYLIAALDAAGRMGGYSQLLRPETTGVDGGLPPAALRISVVAPNPFNPRTTIGFDVAREGRIQLRIYDLRGRRVRTLIDAPLAAGGHQAVWDGRDERGDAVAAGVYLARLSAGGETRTAKAVLAR